MSSKLPFKRALAAIGGSAGMALSSLVLALCLMQKGAVEEYGLFAFLLITQALANGVSNAILGAPLLIALNESTSVNNERVRSFMLANLALCMVFACVQASFAWLYSESGVIALVYTFSGFATTLRWFGRSYCNNCHQHQRVVYSDAIYSVLCLSGAAVLYLSDWVDLYSFGLLTAVSAIFALFMLGAEYFQKQFTALFSASLDGFLKGYRAQGKHALIGVVSTEATVNAHSYLVTFLLGPKAFAPLAAATLLFRPANVVFSSLMQIERPRLRKLIAGHQTVEARKSLKRFYTISISFWLANSVAAALLLSLYPALYWSDSSSLSVLFVAAGLMSLIVLVRALRNPVSVFLQAQDRFKTLANITLFACAVTIPLVYILLVNLGVAPSLFGVLVGDLIALTLIALNLKKELQGA
ncbi:lipopolysaccharide biosynthesis protein [Bowmanella yangjiangensis]|uniref:Polysaccharide biosynthesis protein n=1 Tax=Bowmanella yangjiangensis TaxID=2811230 RepID=A0ABS3CX61_9ALTE|nr:hypothetical protein [Bowmanella yangjiangensis]MBN7820224.1 hypothetical protein [Bowmanella yangjiangensis]